MRICVFYVEIVRVGGMFGVSGFLCTRYVGVRVPCFAFLDFVFVLRVKSCVNVVFCVVVLF